MTFVNLEQTKPGGSVCLLGPWVKFKELGGLRVSRGQTSPAETVGFGFFSSCLVWHLSDEERGERRSRLINIARNTQLRAACAVDSALWATREHPFHLPRIFRDVVFILKTKANGLGGDPQSSLCPCHPSFPSEWLKPSMTERY